MNIPQFSHEADAEHSKIHTDRWSLVYWYLFAILDNTDLIKFIGLVDFMNQKPV